MASETFSFSKLYLKPSKKIIIRLLGKCSNQYYLRGMVYSQGDWFNQEKIIVLSSAHLFPQLLLIAAPDTFTLLWFLVYGLPFERPCMSLSAWISL